MSLHERIAAALGWTVEDTRSLGLHSLREVVRPISAKLTAEIEHSIRYGSYILGETAEQKDRT